MNVAFQALVLFVLVLPGIIVNRFGHPVPRFRERPQITEALAQGLIVSALLHALWCLLAEGLSGWTGVRVSLFHAFVLASGQFTTANADFPKAIKTVADHPLWVLSYFLSLYFSSAVAGKILGNALYTDKGAARAEWINSIFDHGPGMRSWGEWETDLANNENIVDARLFAAVVELSKSSYLYIGLLGKDDTKYDENGEPNRFLLTGVMRRKLEDDDSKFYEIKSDRFILRMSEIKTINLWWAGMKIPVPGNEEDTKPEDVDVSQVDPN